MISVKINLSDEQLRRVADDPAPFGSALFSGMTDVKNYLTNYIITNKLSGQVLNRVTGTLQRSMEEGAIVEQTAPAAARLVFRLLDPKALSYGRLWEFGGTIPGYIHHNLFGRGITAVMPERTVAARPYTAPSISESLDVIRRLIAAPLVEAFKGHA